MKIKFIFIFLSIIICSCSNQASKSQDTTDSILVARINPGYIIYRDSNLTFQVADIATVNPVNAENEIGTWFNISYPQYDATIYCSYLPITDKTLRKALEDSYHLAYNHTTKADGINQNLYTNEEHHTFGIIYDIKGQVAVPIQFYLTDSVSNFFRGSVYYNNLVNADSVAPITENLRMDVVKIMESLEWQH